ncbi:hypothetical protein JIN85_06905 [Luteolibacter pohnpeiensis]|uniref:Penicillin-binding protein 2 n=1 Tax=Luteolibacter pohnpeiensis TaxID=454153 RepID=A0A934S6H1_9BACT|nr:penicillin-binding transpeptidase domain-containing protein [Luteolibacter pohnpeiensis]MBK1882135.1 hypothetical protein [Luteolibacter pohnpeiensis]
MQPHFRFRLYLLTTLIVLGIGALLSRLYSYQIERRDEFLKKVPGSHSVSVREPGVRGQIKDRSGVVLAENVPEYIVSLNLEEIKQAYSSQYSKIPKVERITREQGMDRKQEVTDIIGIVKTYVIKRLAEKDLKLAANFNARNLGNHYLTFGGLIPFTYRTDLTYEEFARFAEHNLELPGVYVGVRPKRTYPYGSLASHVLGYLKKWERDKFIPEEAARKFNLNYLGDDKGIAGVEATMDDVLCGLEGVRTVLKDEKDRMVRVTDITNPGAGADVTLTIDAHVQYLLENSLRLAGRAAGVVMDVNTGEVLAMASVPDYNPNDFVPSISPKKWEEYLSSQQLSPLTNRAISSYTPGSTMKIPTAFAGALAGMAKQHFSCDGYVPYGNSKIGCWIYNMHGGSHGMEDLSEAIQHSCNPYFNKLANAIGWKAMVEGCQLVGIGQKTGIELPNESAGTLTGSREWRAANPGQAVTPVLTAFLSIGQGDAAATPLQMCAVAACVANGGKYYQPRIVKTVVAANGKVLVPDTPKLKIDLTKAGISAEDIELIRHGMYLSSNKPGGTSGKVRTGFDDTFVVAAKSGTAQTMDDGKASDNSWIMSFAPYDHPRYAICVMVQNGKSGGGVAGPLVNLVYRGLHARDSKGIRLPLKPQEKADGFLGELVESIEVPAEMIASVEAGDTSPTQDEIAEAAAEQQADQQSNESDGETGDEVGDISNTIRPTQENPIIPDPTITPVPDQEGTIPRAILVPENN